MGEAEHQYIYLDNQLYQKKQLTWTERETQ